MWDRETGDKDAAHPVALCDYDNVTEHQTLMESPLGGAVILASCTLLRQEEESSSCTKLLTATFIYFSLSNQVIISGKRTLLLSYRNGFFGTLSRLPSSITFKTRQASLQLMYTKPGNQHQNNSDG